MSFISGQLKVIVCVDLKTAVFGQFCRSVFKHFREPALYKDLIGIRKKLHLLFQFYKLCRSIIPHLLRNIGILRKAFHRFDRIGKLRFRLVDVLF